MTNPPSSAPMASVARVPPRLPSSSSSSIRSSCPSLSQRIRVGGAPASSARSRLRSRSIRSGGKKPNWRSTRSSRSSSRGKAPIRARHASGSSKMASGSARPRPAGGRPRGDARPRSRPGSTSSGSGPEASSMMRVSAGSSSSRVRRDTLAVRSAVPSLFLPHRVAADRQNRHLDQLFQRALGGEVETADRADVVSPPLQPGRSRHSEPVDVQDAAPHAELGHLGHGRHPLIAHRSSALATEPGAGDRTRRV